MALQSKTQIFIGGKPIKAFKEFILEQKIDAHHFFELVCRMDVLENFSGELASETRDFLGQTLTLQVSSMSSFTQYKELEFKGIVTAINSSKGFHSQDGDVVIIQGYSTSIIADDGPHYASHNDVDLSEILDTTFQGYDQSKLETLFSPEFEESLHYSVQAGESSFGYASRLAAQYSQWFYYSGKALVFGKPEQKDPINLTYGHDLQQFSMNLKPLSNNYKFFTNDYLTDEHHESSTAQISSDVNGYNSFTSKKSKEIFAKETRIYINSYNDEKLKQRLDKLVEQQKKATDAKQVIVTGISDNPGVNLGETINIQGDQTNYGTYRVIKVTHTNTENGRYQNSFEAITAEAEVYPNTNIYAYPKSETQVARVMDNADPDGMSRVRVQFSWQKPMGEMTPWLRIVTPHAGGDKGFHFIPEIGEEVLIGFEGGNAERPYMTGSLYNGSDNPNSWQSDANDIKAIRTRSGHTIELNDAKGGEMITITDKNSNIIQIDTVNNNIEITALENMTLSAKNIKIRADEDINMVAGKDFTKSISENYNVMTKNNNVIVEENLSTDAKNQVNVADEITVSSNKENLTLTSGKTVDVQSKEKVKLF